MKKRIRHTITLRLLVIFSVALAGGCGAGDSTSEQPTATNTGTGTGSPTTSSGTGGTNGGGGNNAGGNVVGGGGSGGGSAGAGGIAPPACGNDVVDPGELCFGIPHTDHPTGKEDAVDFVVADCDGDSDSDVITADFDSDTVTALRHNGTGQFPQLVSTPCGDHPVALVAGFLDSAEGLDLVVAHDALNQLTPFSANPANPCGFTAQTPWTLSGPATDVALGDFNDDGAADVVAVISKSGDDAVAFRLNTPGATIIELTEGPIDPTAIAAGDLDGDDVDDIVYASEDEDRIYVRANIGSTFGNAVPYPAIGESGSEPADLAIGDLDDDDDNDVVVANRHEDTVSVFLNDGFGVFALAGPNITVQGGAGSIIAESPRSIALGDMDADGDLDIVTANAATSASQSSVTLLVNDGAANFTLATQANLPNVQVTGDFPLETGRKPYALKLLDFNKDGALDIITSSALVLSGTSNVSIILANP